MVKRVCLVFDTEGPFYYWIPSPHFSRKDLLMWRVNKLAGRLFRYPQPPRRGMENLVNFFKNRQIKATFCVCGFLFNRNLPDRKYLRMLAPRNDWYFGKIGKDWYYWFSKGNKYALWGDFLKEVSNCSLFEIGFHGFAHEAMTLESEKQVEKIVSACVDSAKNVGIRVKSFAAPFNLIEDTNDPGKVLRVLERKGIKNCQYAGRDNGVVSLHGKESLELIEKKNGIRLIRGDGYFEATTPMKNVKKTIKKIKNSSQRDFLVISHDFTWKNLRNLKLLVDFCEKEGIEFIQMSDFGL